MHVLVIFFSLQYTFFYLFETVFYIKICCVVKIYVNDCTNILYVDVPNLLTHPPVIVACLDCFQCLLIINYVLVKIFMHTAFWFLNAVYGF